jgi:hypothetical protein
MRLAGIAGPKLIVGVRPRPLGTPMSECAPRPQRRGLMPTSQRGEHAAATPADRDAAEERRGERFELEVLADIRARAAEPAGGDDGGEPGQEAAPRGGLQAQFEAFQTD